MRRSMTSRSMMTTGVLAVTAMLGTSPVAAAKNVAQSGSGEVTAASLAANRTINIVGLPMKAPIPSTWGYGSPKAVSDSGTTNYPTFIRQRAAAERTPVAKWVAENSDVNVMAMLHPTRAFSQGIVFLDIGPVQLPFADLKKAHTDGGAVITSTSQVRTAFGMAYRVHYIDRDELSGVRHRGVTAIMRVNGHLLMVMTAGLTPTTAAYPNDLALKGASRR